MSKERVKNCIIDARVSSDKQLGGTGLENQVAACESFVQRQGWNKVETFEKSYSGRAEERRDFYEILRYIEDCQKSGIPIDYYLVKSIDRLTRLGNVAYAEMKSKIRALGVKLVDTYGVIQDEQNTLQHLGIEYPWSVYEPSETSEMLEAKRGKDEVRDVLSRMIGAEISLAREGFSVRSANDGYLNKKEFIDGKQRTVLAQDPERAHFFKEMFRLRATGGLTDKEIVSKLNALGYQSKPQKRWSKSGKDKVVVGTTTPKQLTVKQLQRIVQRPIYAGIKVESWLEKQGPTRAHFAEGDCPIATIELFNKANRGKRYIKKCPDGSIQLLHDYTERAKVKRLKYHPDYRYDKMIACPHCNKPLKNSGKGNKGKLGKYYQGYHCDRLIDGERHYFREPKEIIETNVTKLLNNLKFKDDFLDRFEKRLVKRYRAREKEILGQAIEVGKNVTELKEKQNALIAKLEIVSNPVVIRKIEDQIEEQERQIIQATEERDKIEIKERDIKSFTRYAKDLMEHPIKILGNNKDPYEQEAFFGLIFERMPTYQEIVSGTPKLTPIFRISEEFKVDESLLVMMY